MGTPSARRVRPVSRLKREGLQHAQEEAREVEGLEVAEEERVVNVGGRVTSQTQQDSFRIARDLAGTPKSGLVGA